MQRLGLIVASLLMTGAILELAVRIAIPQDVIKPMVTQLDPELIYTLKPNYDAYLKGTAVRLFHLKTNSLGLREREIPFEKPPGVFRIELLGDSVSMAEGVELEETYLKQLESRLHAQGWPNVETINAAIRGYGTDQELLLFRRIGKRFHPDLVILAMYTGNDLDDNWAGQLFRLEGGALIQQPATLKTSEKYRFYTIQSRVQQVPGYTFLMAHSQLANLVRVVWAKILQDTVTSDSKYGPEVSMDDRPEFQLTAGILQQWDREVRDAGARPLVMIIPTREEAQAVAMKSSVERSQTDLALERVCRELELAVLNLTPQVAQHAHAEALWLKDGHLSPEGHRWVAQVLFEALRANRMLPHST